MLHFLLYLLLQMGLLGGTTITRQTAVPVIKSTTQSMDASLTLPTDPINLTPPPTTIGSSGWDDKN